MSSPSAPVDKPFKFFHPIEVRYGDLDPQWHVNNAKFLTYFETARLAYVAHLGLWDGMSFLDIGFILADIHLTFHAPVTFRQPIHVGVRIPRLGNKSLNMEYLLEDSQTSQRLATGTSVLVAYDYRAQTTVPLPTSWRERIATFEGLPHA